jgi:hypothetical protein
LGYCLSAPEEPIRFDIPVQEINKSSNIRSFGHDYDIGGDCIDINYTVGEERYRDPDEKGRSFEVDYKRKLPEEIDAMISSGKYDGYFIGDEINPYGTMYKIKGVVKGKVCYYNSQKIVFERMPYRTVWRYDEEKGIVHVARYPSYLRHMIFYGILSVLFVIVIGDTWSDIFRSESTDH